MQENYLLLPPVLPSPCKPMHQVWSCMEKLLNLLLLLQQEDWNQYQQGTKQHMQVSVATQTLTLTLKSRSCSLWECPSLFQKYEMAMWGVQLDQHHLGVPVVPAVAGGNGSWVCFWPGCFSLGYCLDSLLWVRNEHKSWLGHRPPCVVNIGTEQKSTSVCPCPWERLQPWWEGEKGKLQK